MEKTPEKSLNHSSHSLRSPRNVVNKQLPHPNWNDKLFISRIFARPLVPLSAEDRIYKTWKEIIEKRLNNSYSHNVPPYQHSFLQFSIKEVEEFFTHPIYNLKPQNTPQIIHLLYEQNQIVRVEDYLTQNEEFRGKFTFLTGMGKWVFQKVFGEETPQISPENDSFYAFHRALKHESEQLTQFIVQKLCLGPGVSRSEYVLEYSELWSLYRSLHTDIATTVRLERDFLLVMKTLTLNNRMQQIQEKWYKIVLADSEKVDKIDKAIAAVKASILNCEANIARLKSLYKLKYADKPRTDLGKLRLANNLKNFNSKLLNCFKMIAALDGLQSINEFTRMTQMTTDALRENAPCEENVGDMVEDVKEMIEKVGDIDRLLGEPGMSRGEHGICTDGIVANEGLEDEEEVLKELEELEKLVEEEKEEQRHWPVPKQKTKPVEVEERKESVGEAEKKVLFGVV